MRNVQHDFFVTQPGSSVATSLSDGEAKEKKVGVLKICGEAFDLIPIPLQTVRPFLMDTISLEEADIPVKDEKATVIFLIKVVEEMLKQYRLSLPAESENPPMLPLTRLKVEYSGGYKQFHPHRFGQHFLGRVANPKEILLWYKRQGSFNPQAKGLNRRREKVDVEFTEVDNVKLEDLIIEALQQQKMDILPEVIMNESIKKYVEKEDSNSILRYVSGFVETWFLTSFIVSLTNLCLYHKICSRKQLSLMKPTLPRRYSSSGSSLHRG